MAAPLVVAQAVGARLPEPLSFSVIIPTLNEEQTIGACIERVWALCPDAEIVVADGGSQDETVTRAQAAGATVCHAHRGRGPQCNAGAAQARGTVLLFLYADTLLPPDAFVILSEWFNDEQVQIGTFCLSFDVRHPLLDPAPLVTQLDWEFTRFGDQCIVVRRTFFDTLGGFPDWPLFEDVRLFERARARTCVHSFPACVTSSARKYMQRGVLNNHLSNIWMIVQYLMGVSPHELARRYWGTPSDTEPA